MHLQMHLKSIHVKHEFYQCILCEKANTEYKVCKTFEQTDTNRKPRFN